MHRTHHDLSDEPPVGTVAAFNVELSDGREYNGDLFMHHPEGWCREFRGSTYGDAPSWADLTDLELINLEIVDPKDDREQVHAVSVTVTIIGGGVPAVTRHAEAIIAASRYLREQRKQNGRRRPGFDLAADFLIYAAMDIEDGVAHAIDQHIDDVRQSMLEDETEQSE